MRPFTNRPQCVVCGCHLPTINGRCATHLSLATQAQLHCVDEVEFSAIPRAGGGDRWGIQAPPASRDGFLTDFGGVSVTRFGCSFVASPSVDGHPTTYAESES